MHNWRKDDSGAVAITVAILVVVIMALVAIVLDAGYLFAEKRQLQAAADAAALAGAWELAHDQPASVVLARAEEYALKNAVAPGNGLAMLKNPPDTVVGADYVKVTVEKDSPLFFANVFGLSHTPVNAQSVAQVQYLTGVRNPVPWALPILNVTRGVAWVDGGASTDLGEDAGRWSGEFAASPGPIRVRLFNDQTLDPAYPDGVPEEIGPVGQVVVLPAASLFADIQFEDTFYTPGESAAPPRIRVQLKAPLASGEKIVAGIGNKPPQLTQVTPTSFEGYIDVPPTDRLWESFAVRLAIEKNNNPVEEISPVGFVVNRRSSYPVLNVEVGPTVFQAGTPGVVGVDVYPLVHKPGVWYTLKVTGGGAEIGHFMALDFGTIHHSPFWSPVNQNLEYNLPAAHLYENCVAGATNLDFDLHINDTVWTKTGNVAGPTDQGLDKRFAGWTMVPYSAWDGNPSPQLLAVPITEKVQEQGGQTPLRVVNFATFYIETKPDKGGAVRGIFVDYTNVPGTVGGKPGGPFSIAAPRLVKDHVDY